MAPGGVYAVPLGSRHLLRRPFHYRSVALHPSVPRAPVPAPSRRYLASCRRFSPRSRWFSGSSRRFSPSSRASRASTVEPPAGRV